MTNPTDMTKPTRDKVIEYMLNQGPSTVLLFCILFGGGYAIVNLVPQHLQQIQSGYDRNSSDLKEIARDLRDTSKEYGAAVNKLAERVDDLTKRVDRLMERDYVRQP